MREIIIEKCTDKENPMAFTVSPELQEKKLRQRIQRELNLVGINPKACGYTYLTDAIAIVYHNPEPRLATTIACKRQKSAPSVERAMQAAIDSAWKKTDIEDLLKYYTARIHSDKGVPTLTEFIYYYANKLKNEI